MLTETLILQLLSFITLFFFRSTYSILTLWYLAGVYLVSLGALALLDDGDIFIGFLWVIDLGVGLIFFIFILHYSTFLYQKARVDKSSRELTSNALALLFLLIFFFFFLLPIDSTYSGGFEKTWFFYLSWYDYYDFYFTPFITDLNLLRELYFYTNSFEFFLINFALLYGIVASIILSFLIKRVFVFLTFTQITNLPLLNSIHSVYFIRNQNYLKQQYTSAGTRVWLKSKKIKL